MNTKQKMELTSFGEALYPYLNKPDTEYSAEGIYQVKLKLSRADAEKDIKVINDIISQEVAKEHKAKPGNTGLLKRAPLPYVIEGDVVTFKFKTKFKPTLIDHNAKALPEDVTVWGGSIMRINYTPSGYNVSSTGIGCSLRLVSCQIKQLVEGSNATQGMEAVEPVVADNPLNITEGSY